jgi:hypothetical protein
MAASRIRLSSIPPWGAAAAGVPFALAFALMPADWLTAIVDASGIATVVSAARPPLGATARLALAIGGGAGVASVVWAALFLLFGPGGVFAREGGADGMPEVRSADTHPDAPTRRPLSAADLGSPTPAVEYDTPLPIAGPAARLERPLPQDLEQPLARFDPAAVPDEPRAPAPPVRPLATRAAPLGPGERIASVELSSRDGGDSVEALLARLERGTRRRHELGSAG